MVLQEVGQYSSIFAGLLTENSFKISSTVIEYKGTQLLFMTLSCIVEL